MSLSALLLLFSTGFMSLAAGKAGAIPRTSSPAWHADKKIVVVTWANDGGLWTDQVLVHFKQHLEFTGIKIDTTIVTWSIGKSKESLIKTVKFIQPDVLYFPQEHLYLFLAEELAKVLKATHFIVNNVEFDFERMNLLPRARQHVVSTKHDFDYLFDQVKRLSASRKPVRKIGLMAPDYHRELINKIRLSAARQGLSLEVSHTRSWKEYVEHFARFEQTQDAIFPLPPFEVMQDDKRIAMHNFRSLVNGSRVMTIGYRRLGNIRRTIDFNITPSAFGVKSAYLVYDYLTGKKIEDKFISTRTMSYNFEHLRTLNFDMPANQGTRFSLPAYRR